MAERRLLIRADRKVSSGTLSPAGAPFSSESDNRTSAARAHCNVLIGMFLLILVFAGACRKETDQSPLPEDPCAVLDRREVESVLESKVTTVERVPSIDQVIEQQNKGGAASDVPQEARRLCSYTTTGPVGSVIVGVFPDEAAQRFDKERKNAENVQGLGNDAYFLDRGNRVQVLVGDSQMLSIYFQQPAESETAQSLLRKLASRALKASSQAAALGDPKSVPSSSRLA